MNCEVFASEVFSENETILPDEPIIRTDESTVQHEIRNEFQVPINLNADIIGHLGQERVPDLQNRLQKQLYARFLKKHFKSIRERAKSVLKDRYNISFNMTQPYRLRKFVNEKHGQKTLYDRIIMDNSLLQQIISRFSDDLDKSSLFDDLEKLDLRTNFIHALRQLTDEECRIDMAHIIMQIRVEFGLTEEMVEEIRNGNTSIYQIRNRIKNGTINNTTRGLNGSVANFSLNETLTNDNLSTTNSSSHFSLTNRRSFNDNSVFTNTQPNENLNYANSQIFTSNSFSVQPFRDDYRVDELIYNFNQRNLDNSPLISNSVFVDSIFYNSTNHFNWK